MSQWSLEREDGTIETLTLAALEERVRSGAVSARSRVSRGGSWIRVDDVPYLRRHLRTTPAAATDTPSTSAVLVRHDADGKPIPPDPEQIDALLRTMSQRPQADRMKHAARWLWAVAVVLLVLEAIAFGNLLLKSAVRR